MKTLSQKPLYYESNIYELLKEIKEKKDNRPKIEVDTLAFIQKKAKEKKDDSFNEISRDEISKIFLFFDYDGHDHGNKDTKSNKEIKEMLDLFYHSTSDQGKLYISYPMSEALKDLPKDDKESFQGVTIEKAKWKGKKYKRIVGDRGNLEYQDLRKLRVKPERLLFLISEHLKKMEFIVNGKFECPTEKISQEKILLSQEKRYLCDDTLAVLSAVPIFLFDEFGIKKLIKKIRTK